MKKLLMMFFVALTVSMQSCDNNDDLWAAIDDLKGRVQALEKNVKDLNGNIDALRELYSGKTISGVVVEGDKYVLTLSDGTKIELKQGSDADALIPVMGIDENGYWQVSYDGGKTFESLGVKATANDGKTPQFRIDETTGYWQVRYSDTEEYKNVLDSKGNPVKAVGTGSVTDKFFDDVQVKGDLFYIKLHDGTELNIPILKDFQCVIHTPSPGVQKFNVSETKTFVVDIKGADNYIVTAPDGWAASLSAPSNNQATLTVTAPDMVTRASADNTKDVSILITSNSYASISKIQVELDSSVPAPTAAVANSATTLPTASSLTFDVAVTNADGWKYICQKSSDAAPAAVKVIADGTTGSGTSVTVSGLDAGTSYTIYVVAYKDALNSGVQSAVNTTAAAPAKDYYEDGITLGGVTYSKNTAGVQLLTDAGSITAAGVYFLDPQDAAAEFTLAKVAASNVVIIGRKEGAKPKLTITGIQSFNGASGAGFIFKNLDITCATNNYAFNFGSTVGTYDNFIIEDCNVVQTKDNGHLTYFNAANSAIVNTVIRNSRIEMRILADAAATRVLNWNATKVDGMQSIIFENSIVYAPNFVANGALIAMPTSGASTTNLDVKVENNTFVDFIGQPNGFINLTGDKSLSMKKNIFWAPETYDKVSYMFKYSVITTAPAMDVAENIFYGLKTEGGWIAFHTSSSYKTAEIYTREATDPFSGGTFTPAAGVFIPGPAYAGYGADLK